MQCIMKFTKQQVKQIIKEEIDKYIFEQDPFPSITLDNPEAMEDKTGEEETSDGDDEEEEELDADDWEGAFSSLWMMTAKSMAKDFIKKGIQPSRKSPRMRELRSWLMRNPVPQDSNRYEEFIENEIGFRGRIEDETVRMAQKFYERIRCRSKCD